MKKDIIGKKTRKRVKKKKINQEINIDKYGDKVDANIDYRKDKPPHW